MNFLALVFDPQPGPNSHVGFCTLFSVHDIVPYCFPVEIRLLSNLPDWILHRLFVSSFFAVEFVAVMAFCLVGIAPFSSSRVIRVALAGSLDKAQKTRRTINNRAEYLSESRLGLPCSSPCPARSARKALARAAFLCS